MTNTAPIIEKTKSSADVKAILCALAAVSIWGWWMSATRVAATGGVEPIDVAFLRYLVPAVVIMVAKQFLSLVFAIATLAITFTFYVGASH